MLRRLIILSALFFCFIISGISQGIKVSAKIDSGKILIGDHVKLYICAGFKNGTTVVWPELKEDLSGNIRIINTSTIDSNSTNDSILLKRTYTLTSYDSGSFYIPSIVFKFKNNDDTTFNEAYSDSLLLNVNTIAVDTTKTIKDIKGPVSVPYDWREIIPYVAGTLLLAALIWFAMYYIRRRKKGLKLIDFSKPDVPAHISALMALEALKNKKLWQNNKTKEYYTELTEIIRMYIEKRFAVAAMEMTSDEIVSSFRSIDISDDLKSKLKQLFVLADLVKFAKATPLPNEHDLSYYNAEHFVKETKPQEIIKPEDNSHV